jgi:hypothetical protein
MRHALQNHVTDAALAAQRLFIGRGAVFVDDENVRIDVVQLGQKIQYAGPPVDAAFLHAGQGRNHVLALVLRVHGIPALELPYGVVRPDAHVEFAVRGRFLQKGHVPAVQHVETSGDEDFFN